LAQPSDFSLGRKQFPNRYLVACMELHTFSSLNETFLNEYKGCMNDADEAMVYFNPHTIEHKKLKTISVEQVKNAFEREDIKVFTESAAVKNFITEMNWDNKNLLLMSSGNFDGIDYNELGNSLIL
jgi:UDP-N-acetylmuramate: L-alanyl-gamma-D-glutamyl-meso-diaminopimelate ligase